MTTTLWPRSTMRLQHREQAFHVVAVEAGGGFVEQEQGACWHCRFRL